ncbi:MAG: 4Fe-4S dicluster domain-containing protein [Firmicutes bacterium]|nr:4Fe-4S dicluster domain-containing protein [Bacillota bacterium]
MNKTMLIDTSKCVACRACQTACKQWNQLPAEQTTFSGSYENPPAFTPNTWTKIAFREHEENDELHWYFSKQGCMHCSDAACMTVCPTGAIFRTSDGTVSIDKKKCIGCNYCAANCPFEVIAFCRTTNMPDKCTFCEDRVANGLQPACASVCPTGAIEYGLRTKLLTAAYDRVSKLQAGGKANASVYGASEVGGTAMLYVLEDTPEYYGLPTNPQVPFTARIWGHLFKPVRVLILIAMAFGLWANRKESDEVQEAKESNTI